MSTKLKKGIMTNAELAEWFGITLCGFKSHKKKKLEELAFFADFTEEKGKVNISEIYITEYQRTPQRTLKKIVEVIDEEWSQNGLDTCARVSSSIRAKLGNLDITDSTLYNYTIKARNEQYGKPFQDKGNLGSCIYVWCKKQIDKDNNITFDFLTPAEKAIKDELIKKYFGNTTEKQLMVKEMVQKGEIHEEDAWLVLEELTNMGDVNFLAFLSELQDKIGCQVVKGTFVMRNNQRIFIET